MEGAVSDRRLTLSQSPPLLLDLPAVLHRQPHHRQGLFFPPQIKTLNDQLQQTINVCGGCCRRFSYGAMPLTLTTSKRTPSPGPSMTSTPMTMTGAGAASGFQRTGSGRNWSSSATNQHQPTTATTTFHQIALQLQQQQQQQQQNNLDSLESCDSGVSLGLLLIHFYPFYAIINLL